MKNSNSILKSTLTGALALSLAGIGSTAFAGTMGNMSNMTPKEKKEMMQTKHEMAKGMQACFGVNAAYKNDCMSPGHSCAGQDPHARDPNAYVMMPAGLCSKIAGGKVKPLKNMMHNMHNG